MSRKPNLISSEPLTITTTPTVHKYLESLVATGLFGKSKPEAAERLITRSIEELLLNETLKKTE